MDGQNTNPQDQQQPATPVAPAAPAASEPQAPSPAAPEVSQPEQAPQPAQEPQQPEQPAPPVPAPAESTPSASQPEAAPATPAAPATSSESQASASPQPEAAQSTQEPPAAASSQAAAPVSDSMHQTVPLAGGEQVRSKKGGMNPLLLLSFVLLVIVLAGSAYFYMLGKNQPKQEATKMTIPTQVKATPTLAVTMTPSPSGSQSATGRGTVSGTLCYPSSTIPGGTITAKEVNTTKLYTQAYAGSAAGGGSKYTFDLPVGSYHLKFTPTQYPTTIGYYTTYSNCVGNPTGPDCSGQKTRSALAATVSAGMTVQNVNLCDYYYPSTTPPQF